MKTLRNKQGWMIAKISPSFANYLMDTIKGKFKQKNLEKSGKTKVYLFTDGTMKFVLQPHMEIFIHEGYYIEL